MIKKYLLIIGCLYWTCSGLMAQNQYTLSGIINDHSDKSRLLEGVNVYIPEFGKTGISREGGTYIIRGIGAGIIHVQFSRLGYKTMVKTVPVKDTTTVVNVELSPSAIELEEISVTSNNTRLPDQIPLPVNTYSTQEIHKAGNMNLLTGLSYEPGIDKITVGTGITKPVIRGLSFNRLLLYQFGTRIDNQPWDDRHDMGINEAGVDRVEVIKGPSSLVYGADALGGTLVFLDEKPPASGTGTGDATLGFFTNDLGIDGDIGVKSTRNNGMFYGLRLAGQSHTSYIQGEGKEVKKNSEEEEFAANSKWNKMSGKAFAGISKSWGVSKLTYSYLKQEIGIVELEGDSAVEDEEEQREREMEAPYQDVTSHIISLENTVIRGSSRINLNVAYQFNNRKEFEPLPDKQKELAIGLKLSNFTYDVKYSSDDSKKIGFTLGSQGYFQENENFGLEGLVPDAETNDVGGYALIRYDLPRWNFLAGGRLDLRSLDLESYESMEETDSLEYRPEIEMEKNYSLASGSIGVVFHPAKILSVKANVSSGFTAPNYAQLGTYGVHEGTYRFEAGRQDLLPEQNIETDLGIILETPSISLQLDGYYNTIYNYIFIKNTGNTIIATVAGVDSTIPLYVYDQQDAVIKGGELTADIHPAELKWIDVKLAAGTVMGELRKGGYLPYIPATKFIAGLTLSRDKLKYLYQPYAGFTVSSYLKQDKTAGFEAPTEGYTLLDIHLGSRFKWGSHFFDLDVAVNNILNKSYFNHLSLIKTIGVHEIGRNVMIRLHVPFGLGRESGSAG